MADISSLFGGNAMPNDYFRHQQNYSEDKTLYDSLITEAYNKFGVPLVYYIVTYDVNYDKIFGEDNNKRVLRNFNVQGYYDLPKEMEQYSQFMIEGLDNFHIHISKKHFETASTYGGISTSALEGDESAYTPHEGDILKAKYNDYWYEIIQVKQQEEQFLQEQHSWDLTVKPLKDEHLTVTGDMIADEISAHFDVDDIFNVSSAVSNEKEDYLYNTSGDSETTTENDPYGGW